MILALLGACAASDETISAFVDPDTEFRLESIAGKDFPATATISFPGEGKVLGKAPCNRWSAPQTEPYPWVKIGPILSTRRACPEQAAETAFFDALRAMTLIEATGTVVILSDGDAREMVFRAQK
ncbi:META domain-containing protein [Oceaniglobus trochenteri]|uniref:META domain-containing protein n=1 Tax=Oceaniglobus trochenteri TaxID=2763260 RepID=UPI001CFF72C0|nr:META domain-containing protein [Oceaniglobus trochenteri]